ncbi:RIMS-binding protein 2 isoform X2 [Takifugu rubripes]|uniref:RIMS-binding protein 2 isoform X2 n=1 Tax=Takifugu rubripes TaxID=31033 RepID=UPI0011452407|nr:RIMS-binding protein 2-like isoform X2 [Takifugu rubripes]
MWRGWGAAPRLSPIASHGSQHWVAFFSFKSTSWILRGAKEEENRKCQKRRIGNVIGDKDSDGFYHGESGGLSGYVPSNMVAEIPVDDDYLKHLLMQQGFLPVDHTGMSLTPDNTSDAGSIPDVAIVRRMVALFDYDPWESSPNVDSDAELGFRSGDIIYVLGDMDQDGFYYGDLCGRRGLVPSNFLQPLPWD